MKNLNITFTDKEFKRLKDAKENKAEVQNALITWEQFVLVECCKEWDLTDNGGRR